jgi:hypothetical protein
MAMIELTSTVKQIQQERARVAQTLGALDQAIAVLEGLMGTARPSPASHAKRSRFSAATRRRMALAQKARWAKVRGTAVPAAPAAAAPSEKRPVSAEARRRMSQAQKARWAKVRPPA